MKLEDVRSIAISRGIRPGNHSKTELIRSLQAEEGNFDCFATAYGGVCSEANCFWREDCFAAARKGAQS
jgi:hypothetical protein